MKNAFPQITNNFMDLRIIYRSTFKYKFLNFIASQIICDALRKHIEAYYGLHFTRP